MPLPAVTRTVRPPRLPASARVPREVLIAGAAGFGLAILMGALVHKLGLTGLIVPAALVVAAVALTRPGWMAILVFAAAVMVERGSGGLITIGNFVYSARFHHMVTPIEMVMIVLFAGVLLARSARREAFRLGGPFGPPLAVMFTAYLVGLVVGHANGAKFSEVIDAIRPFGFLFFLPILLDNVLEDEAMLRRAVTIFAGLAIAKGLFGIISLAIGQSASSLGEGGTALTYYEPAANFVTMLLVLMVIAARMRHVVLPLWVR